MDEGVELVVAEMPTATDFQLHIFAALAQEERRLISERTKAALAMAKANGISLGRNGRALAAINISNANEFAIKMRPIILPMIDAGMSFQSIADQLNKARITTFRGKHFHSQTVKNIAQRLRDF